MGGGWWAGGWRAWCPFWDIAWHTAFLDWWMPSPTLALVSNHFWSYSRRPGGSPFHLTHHFSFTGKCQDADCVEWESAWYQRSSQRKGKVTPGVAQDELTCGPWPALAGECECAPLPRLPHGSPCQPRLEAALQNRGLVNPGRP